LGFIFNKPSPKLGFGGGGKGEWYNLLLWPLP
jgi:hypothetical protein